MTGEDEDVEASEVDLDVLEGEAQEEMLPFLRIASLIMHYVFNVTLPEIHLEATDLPAPSAKIRTEFRALAKHLEILPKNPATFAATEPGDVGADSEMASLEGALTSVVDGFNWFLTTSRLPQVWLLT